MSRIERRREKLAAYSYTVNFIKGSENQIADWLSRSAEEIDHRENPLKEELVVNALREETDEFHLEYSTEMKKIYDALLWNSWDESLKKKHKDYFRCLDKLTVHSEKIFYNETRFVPDKSKRKVILEEAHKNHQGITRTKSRIKDWF